MNGTTGVYACCDESRKDAVLGNPALNGIDYLEVLDRAAVPLSSPRQRTLLVHFLNPLAMPLAPTNVRIVGGESIADIAVQWAAPATSTPMATALETAYFAALPDAANVLVVRTSVAGDFSPYVLQIVADARVAAEDPFAITEALPGFDPALSQVGFSFKVECPPEFDCAPPPAACPPDVPPSPPINYLAKDFGSFRTTLLDRIGQLVPTWTASTEADVGVMLAELVAYVGDHLSYQQDAVATEAYIETCRSRISLRRHALLVDYAVHDGCNARAWIHLEVDSPVFLDRALTRFHTFAAGMPASLAVGAGNEEAALRAGVVAFEPMQDAMLRPEHNRMCFHTWGDVDCCLPAGATEATLAGSFPELQAGDVLVFEEARGPRTGAAADADMRHRCAVRLTQVATRDGGGRPLVDPLIAAGSGDAVVSVSQTPQPITEIQWAAADALPFPLCLSSTFIDASGQQRQVADVSVVLGNIVLADHGLRLDAVRLPTAPEPSLFAPPTDDRCAPTQPEGLPVRYRPTLADAPITQAVPFATTEAPVAPGIVPLVTWGHVDLVDAQDIASLRVTATDPSTWPGNLGVLASANAVNADHVDLAVVYQPPGGAHGVPAPVVLERLEDLSLKNTDADYAVTQINARSRILQVPAGYVPPGAPPVGFPANAIALSAAGPVDLVDGGGTPYLRVQATNPLAWPPAFGVLAQGSLQQPGQFNLLVVYAPASGVGVQIPVLVEQFNAVTLAGVAAVDAGSALIRVQSFSGEPDASLSARALMQQDPAAALPSITLTSTLEGGTRTWTPRRDLLQAGAADTGFVVEVEYDGSARLRFGDDTNGARPAGGTCFEASYRVGNGTAGNVGPESLVFLDAADARILRCTNPLAASGGTDPESTDQIRRRAPQAFLTQERAITTDDYVAIAERNPQVDEAVAERRWTGSWYTVFVAAEPCGGGPLQPALARSLTRFVDRYRLAGEDVQLESPQYVSLDIALDVCVAPGYFRADVRDALKQALGRGVMPDGRRGLFAPDTFQFGQTVYLSTIYAAACRVAGVASVTATTFEPQGSRDPAGLAKGEIALAAFQIARMDDDPSHPDHGRLTLVFHGGK
jgi:hypothetical protein